MERDDGRAGLQGDMQIDGAEAVGELAKDRTYGKPRGMEQ